MRFLGELLLKKMFIEVLSLGFPNRVSKLRKDENK